MKKTNDFIKVAMVLGICVSLSGIAYHKGIQKSGYLSSRTVIVDAACTELM